MRSKLIFRSKPLCLLIIFACFVFSAFSQVAADDDVIKIETNLVVSDILVLDKKGRSVQGLKKEDFIITENGEAQNIEMFSLGENVTIPRTIALIIDYSRSLRPYVNTSVEAAKVLVDKLNPKDRMAIIADDAGLLVDFTSDKSLLKRGLNTLKMRSALDLPSRNLQYSVLFAVLNEVFNKNDVYPIIIFQTDGDELNYLKERAFSFDDVLKATEKARATIFTIFPGPGLIGLSEKKQINRIKQEIKDKQGYSENKYILKRQTQELFQQQLALAKIAKTTGGWNDFLETPEQADRVYPRILEEINRRYVIGYYPTNEQRDGNRRNVKIEVRGHPEYIIEGRKTYLSPEPEK